MKKLLNKKGFTLMEMLIVVAIIVILVAISVPTFTNSLNGAKQTADDANLRTAKSVATTTYMLQQSGETVADADKVSNGMWFNIETSKFVSGAYTGDGYGEMEDNDYIWLTIDENGNVKVEWKTVTSGS